MGFLDGDWFQFGFAGHKHGSTQETRPLNLDQESPEKLIEKNYDSNWDIISFSRCCSAIFL